MKIRPELKMREMAGEHVVVMPGRSGADMTRLLALNDSSLYLWGELAACDFSQEDVVRLLETRYLVDAQTAAQDAAAWVARLEECGVLIKE